MEPVQTVTRQVKRCLTTQDTSRWSAYAMGSTFELCDLKAKPNGAQQKFLDVSLSILRNPCESYNALLVVKQFHMYICRVPSVLTSHIFTLMIATSWPALEQLSFGKLHVDFNTLAFYFNGSYVETRRISNVFFHQIL